MSNGDLSDLYQDPQADPTEMNTKGMDIDESIGGSELSFPLNEDIDDTLKWMNIFVNAGRRQRSGGSASHSEAYAENPAPSESSANDLVQRERHDSLYGPGDPEDEFFAEDETPGKGGFQLPRQNVLLWNDPMPQNVAMNLANGVWPVPPPPPEPPPQFIVPPSFVAPPPPPPINQLDVPPPPAPANFPADVPATAERLQKEMRSIAKLAKKDADDAEAFVLKWGTYFEMKERWEEFKSASLSVGDWHPDTSQRFARLTTALNILKAQFSELPDQKKWGIDGIAAKKALKMATLFQLRSDEWITNAAGRLEDIENDLALATSSDSDVNKRLAELFSYTMTPPKPQGDDREFRREVEAYERQQSLKQKHIDDLKKKVVDWAIIREMAELEPAYEKSAKEYEAFARLVSAEQYDEATRFLTKVTVSSTISTFIAGTDKKKKELAIAFRGMQQAECDDGEFTDLMGRISSMMGQLKAFTCIPAEGLIVELRPLFQKAISKLPQTWTADLQTLNDAIANAPDLASQTNENVSKTLANAINTCVDFERAFVDLTNVGGDEIPDAGFKDSLLKPTQQLLAKYTPESLSTADKRKEAKEVLSTHQQILEDTRNRLLATAPLQPQPQLHADLLHEFINAIDSVLSLLSEAGIKALTQQEELNGRRKQLQNAGQLDGVKKLVDSLANPSAELDRAKNSRELATLLNNADDATRDALVEAALDSDGLASLVLQLNKSTTAKVIATIKSRRGDDADYVDRLIERTIEIDLRDTTDMDSFMRAAPPSVVLLTAFTTETPDGQRFVAGTTQRTHQNIKQLNLGDNGDPISMEIRLPELQRRIQTAANNRKEKLDVPNEVPEQVVEKHRELVRETISEITQRMPPQSVTRAMAALYEQTLQKFIALDSEFEDGRTPEEQALALVGGHVVLRMINPDLVSNMEEVKQRTRDQRTAAKIQSKMLQRISNMVTGQGREKEFFDAFPDLVFDEFGNPSPEVVELQAYFRKIVYAGQAARGHAIPAPTITNDLNVIADEFQKAVGVLNGNLQPLLLGKGQFKDSVKAIKGLKAFHVAFPFDLVSTLDSLAQAASNNHPDVTKLTADVQAKAKTGISVLAKFDSVLWEAEGAFDHPVQLRGRLKIHFEHILAVAANEVQPAVRIVNINDDEITSIASDQRLDQIVAVVRNAVDVPKEIGVVHRKTVLLRKLVQLQDPKAAALAIELRTSLPRAIAAFTSCVNGRIDEVSTALGHVEAVSNDPQLTQLRQRVNALRQMDPKDAWGELSMGRNVKLEIDVARKSAMEAQPAEMFKAMTSVAAEFSSQGWRAFIQTLPQDVQNAHSSVLNRIANELETFEEQQQTFKSNLLDSNAAAIMSGCLQKLQRDLKSIRTSDASLQTRLDLMKKELKAYVTVYNNDIINSMSTASIWNLQGGEEYLRAIAQDDTATENTDFYGDTKEALKPRDNEALEDRINRLDVVIHKYYREAQPPSDEHPEGLAADSKVNISFHAEKRIRKALQILKEARQTDDQNRQAALENAADKMTKAIERALKDITQNIGDVYNRRKAALKMNVDVDDN